MKLTRSFWCDRKRLQQVYLCQYFYFNFISFMIKQEYFNIKWLKIPNTVRFKDIGGVGFRMLYEYIYSKDKLNRNIEWKLKRTT